MNSQDLRHLGDNPLVENLKCLWNNQQELGVLFDINMDHLNKSQVYTRVAYEIQFTCTPMDAV